MRNSAPVRVEDRQGFDILIDARSPAEFAIDHIPGAVNCPVLDDDERRIVGTLYKQQGAFEARRVGGAMVAANIARHLKEKFADRPAQWKPLVYCWRGGLRSGSLTTWLRLVGWDAQQLSGGYKSWRRHVITQIETLCPALDLRVLCGATGSAKTRILLAMAAQGHQVLDLEGFAAHKGSLLGALPGGVPQPSQIAFETRIAQLLDGIDPAKSVYVEGESHRIGRLNVPPPLVARMRASRVIEVAATPASRLAYLLRDYAYLGDDPESLSRQLGILKELHGKLVIARWQQWAAERNLPALFAELMALHYDPAYKRSQATHFARWSERQTVEVGDLSDDGIDAIARRVVQIDAALSPSS